MFTLLQHTRPWIKTFLLADLLRGACTVIAQALPKTRKSGQMDTARPAHCLYLIIPHVQIPTALATGASSHSHYSANSKRHLHASKPETDFKLQQGGMDDIQSQLHTLVTIGHELLILPPCCRQQTNIYCLPLAPKGVGTSHMLGTKETLPAPCTPSSTISPALASR